MTNQEILKKWEQGLSKDKVALMYKREYNGQIKIMRSNVKNRHAGRFITNYEALNYVEQIIYKELMRKK